MMNNISRRSALALGASAIAAATLPMPASIVSAASAAKPPTPAWAVGTPGEWDWQVIEAPNEFAARLAWASERIGGGCECDDGGDPKDGCDCEFCMAFSGADVDRKPDWDGKDVSIGSREWCESGLGAYCDRCGNEAHRDSGAHFVSDEWVCEDCMDLKDWEIVDPEYAADERANSVVIED
jgi:hypothetical protein